jgi:hypothetical protein
MEKTCADCGSSHVEAAVVEGAAVRMERSSTMKKVFSVGGQLQCTACLDCGAITRFRGDPKAFAEMLA